MKNRIITNSFRIIKKSFPRFLSLLVISMLGVFTFSGLGATAPDMIKTLDNYLDRSDTYDIKVISTMGLVDKDILTLEKIKGIDKVEGSYSKDLLIENKDGEYVINVSSIPKDINKLKVVDGRVPKKDNEIVVEEEMLSKNNLKIGDKISLNSDIFFSQDVVIVGTVDSSLYFNSTVSSSNRGSTSVGTGTINYYTFCLASNFKQDYYNSIYLTVAGAKKLETSSTKYKDVIEEVSKRLDNISEECEKNRYNQIYNEALGNISEKEEEGNRKFDDIYSQLSSSKVELDKANYNLDIFNNSLISSKKELDQAKKSLEQAEANYNRTLLQYNIKEEDIDNNISLLEKNISDLSELIKESLDLGLDVSAYQEQLTILNTKLQSLRELKAARVEILNNWDKYNAGVNSYNLSYNNYISNLNTYNDNLNKYNKSFDEYKLKRNDFFQEIKDAKDKLKEIEMPSWYIYDRSDYLTYSEYIDDTNSISNLAGIFPFVFFSVSILVSLISMNRMVEDDRGEIGTLKSLGFSNRHILFKYLLFSFLAMLFGGVLGSLLGVVIIPLLIFKIYKVLFDIPDFVLSLNLGTTLLGFIISFVCVCGATIYTVIKELKEKPSELMRPKAPKVGKRVFLEKVSFIWDNISFSNKITVRNLFRYKKRVIVTIFGIAGCCGLMLCGFGIKDSIMDIASVQYGDIFKFDGMAYVNKIDEENINTIFNDEKIESVTGVNSLRAKVDNINVNLFVTEDNNNLNNVVNLIDYKTFEAVNLKKGKVVITEKLASLEGLDVGDKISVVDVNNKKYEYQISAIVRNCFDHFIYMDKDTFEQSGVSFSTNVIYLNTKDLNKKEKEELTEKLLDNKEVINVYYVSTLVKSITDMLNSLDEVVFILIVLAALLSFVVLYNLSNININERKREIATLKVLGFYNKEVDNYITKENIILTVIGIILGLVFGYFLTNAIILTVEIEKARFLRRICVNSYIYAASMSLIFTGIVNIVTHFSLKKIDMIESLKSVE